jgi:hypothetical protein
VNSAASLAAGLPVGRLARAAFVLAAYAVPAAAVWAVLGLVLGALPIGTAALVVAAVYGSGYGAVEVYGAAWPAPGRRWQVPQDLMIGATSRRRVLVWGSILGPGFLTRNPYAGFGMLPVLVAAVGSLAARGQAGGSLTTGMWVAALVGAAHGCGRAVALLRDSASPQDEPFALLLRSFRWRMLDGLALLSVAGAAIVTAGYRF